jgi:hypothetical protein
MIRRRLERAWFVILYGRGALAARDRGDQEAMALHGVDPWHPWPGMDR